LDIYLEVRFFFKSFFAEYVVKFPRFRMGDFSIAYPRKF